MKKTFNVEPQIYTDGWGKKSQVVNVYTYRGHKTLYVPISDLNGFVNCLLFLGFKNENLPN